ncbi:MAG: hypothetical protein Q9N32_08970 [Gammaproteobacteria bacterium]|nr:hypothetical protein [Gammaproteobacteria bacterium]
MTQCLIAEQQVIVEDDNVDIAELQDLIAEGDDPTQTEEAPAVAAESEGSEGQFINSCC